MPGSSWTLRPATGAASRTYERALGHTELSFHHDSLLNGTSDILRHFEVTAAQPDLFSESNIRRAWCATKHAARRAERAKNAHQARSPADRKWRSEKVHCTYCGKNVGKGNFYRHRNGRCVVKASVPCDLCGKEFNLFRAEEKIKLHKENGSCLNYTTKIRFWRGNDQPPSD
ncbi:hypothetical protein ONZ45_g14737 [Pleurotus djamor]|nr:hypothetical protein ONZ45_g14737 [Pleurotus djamor]